MINTIKKIEFNQIFKNSDQMFTNFFILKYSNNEKFRYGISISKKIYKHSVDRNKVNRQIRSSLYEYKPSFNKNLIIVVNRKYQIDNFFNNKKDLINGLNKLSKLK